MNPQFRKGLLELCILSHIADEDCYGYQLVEQISQYVEITEGTIYPILRRLTKEKWCRSYLRESPSGPPRKYYKITAKGNEVFLQQLKEWNLFRNSVDSLLYRGLNNDKKHFLKKASSALKDITSS